MILFVSYGSKNLSPLLLWFVIVCSADGSSCFRMCWGSWRGGKLIWRASQKAALRSKLWWKGVRLLWRRSCVSLMLAGAEFGPGPRTGVTPCWYVAHWREIQGGSPCTPLEQLQFLLVSLSCDVRLPWSPIDIKECRMSIRLLCRWEIWVEVIDNEEDEKLFCKC